jgi:hypothetical protein
LINRFVSRGTSALLLAPTLYFLPRWKGQQGYEHYLLVVFVALFATFFLYGPVLLARQIISSGSRGWFVARLFISIIMVAVLLLGGMYWFGLYTESRGHVFALLFTAVAIFYLQWRTETSSRR